jgi:hypothetical protein
MVRPPDKRINTKSLTIYWNYESRKVQGECYTNGRFIMIPGWDRFTHVFYYWDIHYSLHSVVRLSLN